MGWKSGHKGAVREPDHMSPIYRVVSILRKDHGSHFVAASLAFNLGYLPFTKQGREHFARFAGEGFVK